MAKSKRERFLQEAIAKAIALHSDLFNAVIVDVNVKEYRDKKTGEIRYIKTQETAGVSDLIIACPGTRVIWMEVKLPGKKQTPSQVKFQEKIEAVGHEYCIVENVLEAMQIMTQWSVAYFTARGIKAEAAIPRYYALRDQLQ